VEGESISLEYCILFTYDRFLRSKVLLFYLHRSIIDFIDPCPRRLPLYLRSTCLDLYFYRQTLVNLARHQAYTCSRCNAPFGGPSRPIRTMNSVDKLVAHEDADLDSGIVSSGLQSEELTGTDAVLQELRRSDSGIDERWDPGPFTPAEIDAIEAEVRPGLYKGQRIMLLLAIAIVTYFRARCLIPSHVRGHPDLSAPGNGCFQQGRTSRNPIPGVRRRRGWHGAPPGRGRGRC
jgi:hypothetical protein